ncbi:MAG TPA: hypothetical protein DEB10_03335, partial [Ruminococcaceae bacterium]|nr:hypothetical protein [Oscillospiraceae bacterium]
EIPDFKEGSGYKCSFVPRPFFEVGNLRLLKARAKAGLLCPLPLHARKILLVPPEKTRYNNLVVAPFTVVQGGMFTFAQG